MLEAIVVLFSVIGCIASWYALYQMKDNPVYTTIYKNKNIQIAGIAFTVVIAATAVYFGWLYYAALCLVTAVLDVPIKRAILR